MSLLSIIIYPQVMLNSPKLIEEEKAKMATKEKALIEKEGKMALKAKNTINGTGGTPIHVSTLQVHLKYLNKQSTICIYRRLGNPF